MKLRLHRYAPEQAFRSPADFARYADAQRAKFDELGKASPPDGQAWADSIAAYWAAAAGAARDGSATERSIQRVLDARPVVRFESRMIPIVRRAVSLGLVTAARNFVGFLSGEHDGQAGGHLHIQTLNLFSQLHIAVALEEAERRGARYSSFEAMQADQEERLNVVLEADQEELSAKRAAFDEMLEGASKRHAEMSQRIAHFITQAEAQWLGTHQEFIEQLATETAVELWRNRSTTHEVRYKSFRKGTLWFGGLGLISTLIWIFAGFAAARWAFPDDKTAQIASYTAGSIALFTLFVWGLRVLIRSMMSEDHLATDASARSALAHTYLALTKEEAATAEDRAIILATLFAPVSDGLVKDDGMPAFSPTSLLAQQLTR